MVGLAMLFVIVGCTQETSIVAPQPKITSFAECVAAGNPVMESFPEQCRAGNQTFVKAIDVDKTVSISTPEKTCLSLDCRNTSNSSADENVNAPSEKMRVMPSNKPVPPAVAAGKAFVEAETNSSAIVLNVNEVMWPNHCLGIIDPAATCLAEPLAGYNLTIYSGESEFEIHTDGDGSVIRKAGERQTGPLAI